MVHKCQMKTNTTMNNNWKATSTQDMEIFDFDINVFSSLLLTIYIILVKDKQQQGTQKARNSVGYGLRYRGEWSVSWKSLHHKCLHKDEG